MSTSSPRPRWAPRVSRYKIARLYHSDAMGRQDEALVDDVGYALLARIQDCLTVTEAHQGRVTCPRCRTIIQRQFGHHERQPDEIISCLECGWSITWDEFHRSYRNKHLGSAGLAIIFCEFAEHFPRAQSYQEKIVLIDRVLDRKSVV